MSSVFDADSSVAPSVTPESTTTSQIRKNYKKSSPVWAHTRMPLEDENPDFLYCSYCEPNSTIKRTYGSESSSAMTKHINRYHPLVIIEKATNKKQEIVNQQLRQLYRQAKTNGNAEEFSLEVLETSFDQSILLETLITLIVVRNLSFTIVEWPEFHVFCQVLNKGCQGKITTTHSTVRIKVEEAWKRHKDVVRRTLQAALSHVHISLDIWTSPNRWLLLGICAHFTSYDQKRQKALLALQKVPGHSGKDQFSILLPVLQDYGIVHKLGAVIADNATSNDVLCRTIETHYKDKKGKEWLAHDWRIRCIGHIINLVVQAFLFADVIDLDELESYDLEDSDGELTDEEAIRAKFRLLGPLGQGHNIVAHIRGSSARTNYFRKLAGRMIPMDNRTRWNSWYHMLLVFLELKGMVEEYCENYESELEKDLLSHADWKKLRTIKDFLVPFSRATLATEGDSISIDRTLFTMDILIRHLQETTVSLLSFSLLPD
jgi:hypothetical protein